MIVIGLFTLAMGIILSSIPWLDYVILKVSHSHAQPFPLMIRNSFQGADVPGGVMNEANRSQAANGVGVDVSSFGKRHANMNQDYN
jgi:hypothetical protein